MIIAKEYIIKNSSPSSRKHGLSINRFILFYLTIGMIFPLFKAFTSIPAFYPALLIFIFYTFFNYLNIYSKQSVFRVFLLFIITLIYYYSGYYEFRFDLFTELFRRVLPFLIAALLLEYLIFLKDKDLIQEIGKFSLVLIFITTLFTIFAEYKFPGISRTIGKVSYQYPSWAKTYSFGMIYSIPFIIGALLIKSKLDVKLLVLLITLLVSMFMIGFLTAVIFTLFVIAISFLVKTRIKESIYLIIFVFFIILFSIFYLEIIEMLKYLPHQIFKEKAEKMMSIFVYNQSSSNVILEMRGGVYGVSIKSFFENPLFGLGSIQYAGGHSFWLDTLARFGILGTIPYVIVIVSLYKRAKKILPNNFLKFYRNTFVLILVLMFFNPFYFLDFWTIVFVFIPAIMNYLELDKKQIRKLHV